MNPVHIHLLLNHVPVIATLIGVLLLGYALLMRSSEVTRASLGILVAAAILGGVVFLTGEPAEELVEDVPGVSHTVVEQHEEAALVAALLLGGAGLLSLAGLVVFRRKSGIPQGFAAVVLLVALVPTAAMAYAANLGGQIRHTELRSGAAANAEVTPAAALPHEDDPGPRERR